MSVLENIDLTNAIESKIDRSKWVNWKFSDLVENIVEKVIPKDSGLEHYIGLEHLDSGSLKIKRFGETESLIGDKLKIYKGDLIFAKRNAYLKRVAIADFDAVASAHSLVLRPKSINVLPEFLPFFLLSEVFWERAIEISVGSLSPTINWKVLAKQEFLLPPKEEQAKIAELLWSMDEVIEREKDVMERLYTNYKVWFNNFFNHNLKLDEELLNKGWKIKKAKDICTLIKDGTHGSYNDSEDGIPLLSAKDIKEGLIQIEGNPRLINKFDFESIHKNYRLQDDDILVTIVGTVGNIAIIKNYANQYTFQRSVGILRFQKDIDKDFLYYYMQSVFFQQELKRKAVTSIQSGVYLEELGNCRFIIPDFESINKIKDISNKNINARNELKLNIDSAQSLQKSLINQIF